MQGIRRSVMLAPTVDVIGSVGISAALWFGGREVVEGKLTLGLLAAFLGFLDRIRNGIGGMGNLRAAWLLVQGAVERIFSNVLDIRTDIVEKPDARVLPPVRGAVTFDNVTFEYVPGRPALRNIAFTMNPGEVVALVGESGSGKSTLSDLIPRFYDPTCGTILIDGIDIRDVTLNSLRRQIGIVDQSTMLFGGTVRENIAYGLPDAPIALIEAAARHANALDFISEMPNGFDTVVGQRGIQLSGGQRQRLAIARALLIDPRILILDEATSSLDTASEVLVQEALDTLMHGRTTLVIAHRLSTIVNADRILVLDAGRIIERGTHAELLGLGGKYAALCESQFRSASYAEPEMPEAASEE
jgi:subfamily B ATP-binding cassette protein MsbA